MAGWMTLEEETGTSRYSAHPHNGYYAGDFTPRQDGQRSAASGDGEPPAMRTLVLATGGHLRLW